MRKLFAVTALLLLAPTPAEAQARPDAPPPAERAVAQENNLLADLKALDAEAAKLNEPLARASAKGEIADAAWALDRAWAKALLREAYELTLPPPEERERLRARPAGSDPVEPSATDLARGRVRNRVLGIARRDASLAAQLTELGSQQLGKMEEVQRYSLLGVRAIEAGESEAAGDYLLRAIDADPTQISVGLSILEVAARDRGLADRLLVQYAQRLRAVPATRNSALRTYVGLRRAVFPNVNLDPQRRPIPPAGREAVRAYVGYVLESMARLERAEPGSARELRGFLMSVWLPLNQHAPELLPAFMELEKVSRVPGESADLPTQTPDEAGRADYEERVKKALDSRRPQELKDAFNYALGLEDFARARELYDRLPEGWQKERLGEELNAREAMRLASKGDTAGAERLARALTRPESVLRVYPVLISSCPAGDDSCATTLVQQAMKQLRAASDDEPVAFALSRLSAAAAEADAALAFEVLDEAVKAANRSDRGTADGRTGLYLEVFTVLAPKGETRARQSAEALNDRFRRISALAVVYRWKAQELSKTAKPPAGM